MSKRTVELELATPGLDARGQPVRVPLGVAAAPDATDLAPPERDLAGEHMLINIGPQHPATHGVLRLVVELDGETVVRVIPHLGYLHSGFEKLGEYRHYNQIIPLTDRTDYLSPMANNVGFALAAEKLMGIEITPRCTACGSAAPRAWARSPQRRRSPTRCRARCFAPRASPTTCAGTSRTSTTRRTTSTSWWASTAMCTTATSCASRSAPSRIASCS